VRLAVPDLVSNSYFPAVAAVTLGHLRDEGLDVRLEHVFPVAKAVSALVEGGLDLVAGAAHAPLSVNQDWGDVRLVATLARKMYWFLVVRSDSDVQRDSLTLLRGRRIGAAPGPDRGLRHFLTVEGVDVASVRIGPLPGGTRGDSFGVAAAQSLANGEIDAFWANGMGAEVAVRQGVGRVVVDARRDPSPAALGTFPALMTSTRLLAEHPEAAAAAVRAITPTQDELRRDPSRATEVGKALFPDAEAAVIADLVARDVAYYTPEISQDAVDGLVDFAHATGLTTSPLTYDQIVWRPPR
jgi:ABC-type nitrate/sulfonate/bicarbonate transport system substrate-binding protein